MIVDAEGSECDIITCVKNDETLARKRRMKMMMMRRRRKKRNKRER